MVKAVGVVKLVPLMVTSVPTGPVAGLKEVMVGTCAKSRATDKTVTTQNRDSFLLIAWVKVWNISKVLIINQIVDSGRM